MISEKNERDDGSSSCSNSVELIRQLVLEHGLKEQHLRFACWSHKALSRISASFMVPFELAYMNQLQL
jgi:hypothetical protein